MKNTMNTLRRARWKGQTLRNMGRGSLIGLFTVVFSFSCTSDSATDPGRNEKEKPYILLITSDQQQKGALEVYGNELISTPVLNSVAEDGVVFDRAYTPHATCTPARCSILSGQYASTHGAYTIGTTLSPDALKVSDILVSEGYETYAVGKMHFSPVSTHGSFESIPNILDEEFWKGFNGPFYGFQHVRMLNRHTTESLACREHYGIWLKEHGLNEDDLAAYFNDQFTGTWKLPRELHPSVFVSEYTCNYINEHLEKRKDKPFFIWMSFPDPHNPHVVPAPYDTLVNPEDVEIKLYKEGEFDHKPPIYRELYQKGMRGLSFSDKFGVPSASPAPPEKQELWQKSVALNYGMVKLMDEEIGKVIKLLKEKCLYDNTIIIFTTDHGDYLGNHGFRGKGFPSFEEAYNIPLIIKARGMKESKSRNHEITGLLDLAPTLLDLAMIPIPEEMEGISQKDLLLGQTQKIRNAFIIENRLVEKGFYQTMFITAEYKLVYYYGQSYGELYQLSEDPDQYNNLWDNSHFQDLKQLLLYRLFKKNVSGKEIRKTKYTLPEILELLDRQIEEEGPVQPRTSFS